MGAQCYTSRSINDTLNPKWNFNCQFFIKDLYQDVLCITVFEKDQFSPDGQLMRASHTHNTETLTQTEWIIWLILYRMKGITGSIPGPDALFRLVFFNRFFWSEKCLLFEDCLRLSLSICVVSFVLGLSVCTPYVHDITGTHFWKVGRSTLIMAKLHDIDLYHWVEHVCGESMFLNWQLLWISINIWSIVVHHISGDCRRNKLSFHIMHYESRQTGMETAIWLVLEGMHLQDDKCSLKKKLKRWSRGCHVWFKKLYLMIYCYCYLPDISRIDQALRMLQIS